MSGFLARCGIIETLAVFILASNLPIFVLLLKRQYHYKSMRYISKFRRHCFTGIDGIFWEANIHRHKCSFYIPAKIAKFMGQTWGQPGSCRPQMGPMLAPWTLLPGSICSHRAYLALRLIWKVYPHKEWGYIFSNCENPIHGIIRVPTMTASSVRNELVIHPTLATSTSYTVTGWETCGQINYWVWISY